MTPEERGHFLEEPPEGAPDIDEAHAVRLITCFCICNAYIKSLLPNLAQL